MVGRLRNTEMTASSIVYRARTWSLRKKQFLACSLYCRPYSYFISCTPTPLTILTSTSSYTLVQILKRNANLGDWSWKVWTEKNVVVRLIALFTIYLRVCKLFFSVESGKMFLKCTSALHERKIFFSALTHGRHNNDNVVSLHLISSLWNAPRLNATITSRTSSIPLDFRRWLPTVFDEGNLIHE